ncbi:MAG: putative stress-responsive transcriptional regulator [Candidatus Nanosalina sp. J07AB43]|nr:MAG: putative stress-responsive transcriptional regulator [Candidatus Nanosalina sp. J07AB43]
MDRLYRSEDDKVLGGVCGGIAEKYELDPSLVRLATLVIVLTAGIGLPLYLAAWLIVPPESELENQEQETEDSDEGSESKDEE